MSDKIIDSNHDSNTNTRIYNKDDFQPDNSRMDLHAGSKEKSGSKDNLRKEHPGKDHSRSSSTDHFGIDASKISDHMMPSEFTVLNHKLPQRIEDVMDTITDPKRIKKVAVGAAVVATALSANVVADDIVTAQNIESPAPIVQMVEYGTPADAAPVDVEDEEDDEYDKKRISIGRAISAPIYMIGSGLVAALDFMFGAVMSPVIFAIVRIAVLVAVVLGVAAICLKTAFPDIPLRELLTKRRVISLAVFVAILGGVCEIIPLFWKDGAVVAAWIRFIGGFAILAPMIHAIAKLRLRRQMK